MTDPIVTPTPSVTPAPAPAPATSAPAPAASTAPVAPTTEAPAPAPVETRMVPVPVMEKLRSELQASKSQLSEYQQQMQLANERLALYRANMPAPQQPTLAPPQVQAAVADLLNGAPDDRLIEAGEVRKALSALSQQQEQKVQALVQQALGQLQPKLMALELAQENPQFKQIMKEQLPALIQEQPWVAELIKSLPREKQLATAAQFAMLRARQQAAALPAAPPQVPAAAPANLMDELNRIIENQAKPGNPGAAGGTPATALSWAAKIPQMSSAEFADFKARVNRGEVTL